MRHRNLESGHKGAERLLSLRPHGTKQSPLFVERFGIIPPKQGGKSRRGATGSRVDRLDQTKDVRGHHQQIANGSGTRIPIPVRRSPSDECGGPGTNLDLLFARFDA
jgi:hypothetical protein